MVHDSTWSWIEYKEGQMEVSVKITFLLEPFQKLSLFSTQYEQP